MRRRVATALLLLACVFPARAATHDTRRDGVSETLFAAMRDEMQRTLERLRVEGLAAPYFVAYTVLEMHTAEVHGSFGALERPLQSSARRIQVEVRTGSREFDDSHFVGRTQRSLRPVTGSLPVEDDYGALRHEIWALTDGAYKASLERLARKTVYRESNNIADVLPDLSEDPVGSTREVATAEHFDRTLWERRVREISGVFREYPAVQSSSVELSWRAQHIYFLDSEGRSYVKPSNWFEIELEAEAQAPDGMPQGDERQIVWGSMGSEPSAEDLISAARQLAVDVTSRAEAPQIETYLGPVLLEGQAAGEFFAQLLASGLAGPREIWAETDWSREQYPTGALTGRLGLRVIAPMFTVVDDPTQTEFQGVPLLGHYRIDEQGIPAERVDLVQRGILRDLLMSRSPTKEHKHSNGHGRGGFYEPASAVIGNLFVTPTETVSLEAMKTRLREDARAFGLDRGILIRRIEQERRRSEGDLLATPVLVYEVDVETGEERLVRDAEFHGVTLRALRDIVAASNRQHVYNLAKTGPYRTSAVLESSIVHPSVLLSEMELVKTEDKPSKPPYLGHPFFTRATGD